MMQIFYLFILLIYIEWMSKFVYSLIYSLLINQIHLLIHKYMLNYTTAGWKLWGIASSEYKMFN